MLERIVFAFGVGEDSGRSVFGLLQVESEREASAISNGTSRIEA